MHYGGRSSRSHTMHQVAGREYRLFRARAHRPGNERGCVEPPELERSPQLVTAGRIVCDRAGPGTTAGRIVCDRAEPGTTAGQDRVQPGRTWHHRRTSRPAVTGDLRPRAMELSDGVPVADKSGGCPGRMEIGDEEVAVCEGLWVFFTSCLWIGD